MNGAAPSSRLMQSLRAGYQQQGSFGLVQPQPSAASQPNQFAQTSIDPQVTEPQIDPTSSIQDNLDVLDQVLTEVEQAKAAQTVVQPALVTPVAQVVPIAPVSPAIATPVISSEAITPDLSATPVEAVTPVIASVGVEPTTLSAPAPSIEPMTPTEMSPIGYDPSAQVIPQVVSQATDTLNVAYGRPTAKETSAVTSPVETATGIQYVEEEKVPEIPVEVESYIQRAEAHADQLPQEIVIADVAQAPLASHYAKQPVIVLPITPEIEAAGAKKGSTNSVRWLVEFSRKIMKMFAGKVIYRDA